MNSETSKMRKEEVGIVVANKMDKTIVVVVTRKIRHPKYQKVVNMRKKYYAHDEANSAQVNDTVRISETRPLSKLKRWRLVEVVKTAMTELNEAVKG
jgi:small subunit ribosomal protein S17